MDAASIATSVLSLITGIGIFLIACNMMSANLEALGSRKLKKLFSGAAKSKLVGVGIGAATTVAVQSSSATTVMVIGFVNAGIMSLAQAATVIFGANIGTTVTGQLVALGMFGSNSVSSSVIFGAFAGVGAFILAFAKKDKVQKVGGILAGFGMLFAALSLMSGAMNVFAESESMRNFLATFENPFLLVLVGIVLTALVQSSSVITSITITTVVSGLISLDQGIYITIGSNVGTCVTALIAGLTSTRNARRTALIHLIFNMTGVIVFLTAGLIMRLCGTDYGFIFGAMFPHAPQLQLAMFHTAFNLIATMIALPLTGCFVGLVTKIVPDKPERTSAPQFKYIEEHMLAAPAVAVQQIKREITDMALLAQDNFVIACDAACTLDFAEIEKFRDGEKRLNFLNAALNSFISRLLSSDLNQSDRAYLAIAIKTVTDIERVGDYAENITEYASYLRDKEISFSETARQEITEACSLVSKLFSHALDAYKSGNLDALDAAYAVENEVDELTDELAKRHVQRLQLGECSPDASVQYISLVADVERIADHYINVAKTVGAHR
ncbi:MAG: Na/Pi cotransporter family protein [Clostridia bacterium]|nr:Na/Pi cotransporter family protein [Clostridia bacterium]